VRTTSPTSSLLGRLLGGLFAIALGLLAVFLFTAFAAVAAGLALVGLGRLWWLQRRGGSETQAESGDIEAEYTVERDSGVREADAILPPRAGDS